MDSWPIGVRIPIMLTITTSTKVMKYSETPPSLIASLGDSTKFGIFNSSWEKELFPAPPTSASLIKFHLSHFVYICVERHGVRDIIEHISALGGFGVPEGKIPDELAPIMTIAEPLWIPESETEGDKKDGKGVWMREVRFDTHIAFTCPPTLRAGKYIICKVTHSC
jgi:hypothetical protein